MSGVDNRVVSMTFDNGAFERKMTDTIKSLEKLDATLKNVGKNNAVATLNTEASKFSMDNMSKAIDNVSEKFSAFSVIALATLTNVAMKAVQSGAMIVKSLSLDQVISGYREYETNINSIQTILANTASKGTGLEDVNKALDQLNQYADKTIYNFSQMTRNIGTFTAAGIDLGTSVEAIKGIANLAAISGSNAEQASSAMYQLSQALASGSVKLMDWNSIVNAGMGGEVFQKALFETGKSLKTIKDLPMGQTFEEWKKAGNTFRGSLEEGWLTAEVLTNTLKGFTGDLTEAQVLSMGYTKEQAAEIMKLGQIGKAAATEVKTLTQLVGTVKEAIGSGWAQSFRTIIGDFEEAKQLFTGISNALGRVISASADARNEALGGWKAFGGRSLLLQGMEDAVYALTSVLIPLRDAFREIFPPVTAKTLLDLTQRFANFTKSLALNSEGMDRLKSIARGFFAAISIGIEIAKGLLGVFTSIIRSIFGVSGGFFEGAAGVGDFVTGLRDALVTGGGIEKFFDKIAKAVQKPIEFIRNLKDSLADIFGVGASVGADAVGSAVGRLSDRFESLSKVAKKIGDIWEWLGERMQGVKKVFDEIWDYVKTWASELGTRLAEVMGKGDFNAVIDALNVGLLGGIVLILRKFFKEGLKLDLGGGLFASIAGTFDQLTGTLKAMQTQIRAKALMQIAIAIGILTASVVVLSLIDPVALTTALTAMAVGFGQLIGVFAALNVISTGKGAAKLPLIAAGLILLGGAILVLSVAVKVLSTMDWDELARGMIALSGILVALVVVSRTLSGNAATLIAAGIAMSAMSVGILVLAGAVKAFSGMEWESMAQGLVGVAAAMGIVALASQVMPANIALTGPGLIAIAIGLRIMAEAVESFAKMDWGEMGKGLVGVAGSLVIIAGAMHLFPPNTILTAAGLVVVGIALNLLAKAVAAMAAMDAGELAKGIGSIAAMLLVLAGGMALMSSALPGAAALVVVAGALTILVHVLKEIAGIKTEDIIKGLATVAGVIATLALSAALISPFIGSLLALGAAIVVVGAGFMLFGAGAFLVAKAIEALAGAGKAGIIAAFEVLDQAITRVPLLAASIAEGVLEFVRVLVDAAPVLIKGLKVILEQLLIAVIDLAPKLAIAFVSLVSQVLNAIRELFPQFVQLGADLLIKLLEGIRNNIGDITTVVVEILANFVNALAANIYMIVDAGINLLLSLIKGISDNIQKIIDAASEIIVNFLDGLARNVNRIITAGANFIIAIIEGIGRESLRIARAAMDVVIDFIDGLGKAIDEKAPQLQDAGKRLAMAIMDGASFGLASKAKNFADDVVGTLEGGVKKGLSFLGIKSPSRLFIGIGQDMVAGLSVAFNKDKTAENSIVDLADRVVNTFKSTMDSLPYAFEGATEFNPVITPVLDLTQVQKDAKTLSDMINMVPIQAAFSLKQAELLSHTTDPKPGETEPPPYVGPSEISFEQNIYSPTALSTNDIYRNTRSQIALAKEELSIP